MIGPEIMQQTSENIKMIQENMKVSQSLHMSYHDKGRKTLEFQEGDRVILRVTPINDDGRALKPQKLMPCFVGAY